MKAKVFEIEGFGRVGETNLLHGGFVSTSGPNYYELEVGQSCHGYLATRRQEPEIRVTRLEDQDSV